MQGRLVFCMLLILWRSTICFQLHDILRDLQMENAFLHSKVENMTEMLMELRIYISNTSRGSPPIPEHLKESALCKQDIAWSDSSTMTSPVPIIIVATQALFSFLSI